MFRWRNYSRYGATRRSWALGMRHSIGISSRLCELSTRTDPKLDDSASWQAIRRSTGRKFNLARTIKSSHPDSSFGDIVVREVLSKKRTALLIMGAGQIARKTRML